MLDLICLALGAGIYVGFFRRYSVSRLKVPDRSTILRADSRSAKLELAPANPVLIVNEPGIDYSLTAG